MDLIHVPLALKAVGKGPEIEPSEICKALEHGTGEDGLLLLGHRRANSNAASQQLGRQTTEWLTVLLDRST